MTDGFAANSTVEAPAPTKRKLSAAERVRLLVQATEEQVVSTVDVECPDATKLLQKLTGDPEEKFVVTVRPMKLREMISMGNIPDLLVDKIDEFNTEVAVFQFENDQREGESEEQFNKRSLASMVRQMGARGFLEAQSDIRDASVVACAVEPKVVVSELELDPTSPDEQIALTMLTESDRSVIYRAIQQHTGEMTEDELKSVAESEDQAETDHASVGEVAIIADDSDGGSETDGRSQPVRLLPS